MLFGVGILDADPTLRTPSLEVAATISLLGTASVCGDGEGVERRRRRSAGPTSDGSGTERDRPKSHRWPRFKAGTFSDATNQTAADRR
jgi:hypothetical protein